MTQSTASCFGLWLVATALCVGFDNHKALCDEGESKPIAESRETNKQGDEIEASKESSNQESPEQTDDSGKPFENENAAINAVMSLLRTKQYAEAAKVVDLARAAYPDSVSLLNLDSNIAVSLSQTDLSAAISRFERLISEYEAIENPQLIQSSMFRMSVQSYAMVLARDQKIDEALQVIDRAEKSLAKGTDSDSAGLLLVRARLLIEAERKNEAADLLLERLNRLSSDEDKFSELVSTTDTAIRLTLLESAPLQEKIAEVLKQVDERVSNDEAVLDDLLAYARVHGTEAMMISDTNPVRAEEILNDVKSRLSDWETDDEAQQSMITRMSSQISSSLKQIEALKARLALIGQVAPELNAEHFINGPQVSLKDLKGKVVLLDFWAVWCGPCIAGFPHLRDLHEAHADEGLVILGVTRPYGYAWDEETSSPDRGDDVTIEDELAMLEKFRVHHELPYSFAVTAKDSDLTKQYAVTGIPQMVVIDRDGLIRSIQVGAGEKSAKAIEEMVERLLKDEATE